MNRLIKLFSNLVMLLILLIFLNSCDKADEIKQLVKGKPTNLNLICLVDMSSSIPIETKKDYENIIGKEIISSLSKNDKILVLPIDYGSQTGSKEIMSVNFSDREYSSKMTPLNEKDKKEKENLNTRKDSLIVKFENDFEKISKERAEYSRGTDIFGALKTCSQYFDKEKNNLILIFSDMEHSEGSINMNKQIINKASIEKLIEQSPKISLNNTEIIVYTGEQPNLSIEKYNLYRTFWTEYFKKENVFMVSYESGAKSILIDKIKSYVK